MWLYISVTLDKNQIQLERLNPLSQQDIFTMMNPSEPFSTLTGVYDEIHSQIVLTMNHTDTPSTQFYFLCNLLLCRSGYRLCYRSS